MKLKVYHIKHTCHDIEQNVNAYIRQQLGKTDVQYHRQMQVFAGSGDVRH